MRLIFILLAWSSLSHADTELEAPQQFATFEECSMTCGQAIVGDALELDEDCGHVNLRCTPDMFAKAVSGFPDKIKKHAIKITVPTSITLHLVGTDRGLKATMES